MKYELGTTTELPPFEEKRPRGTRLGGQSGSGGNSGNGRRGGGGGGSGGGDRSDHGNRMEEEQFVPSKYRLLMLFVLLVIMMTFAGLVGAYVFIAVNKSQEWKPFDLPFAVFVSTALILASSATYELARIAINNENQAAFRRWLLVTTALGGMFVGSQFFSWASLVGRGVYMSSNPYAGFFYVLTAAHAFHLIGGIAGLGYLLLRAWNSTRNKERLFKRQTAASVIGLYWHSMDGLWLVLFALLAFWK
jgi:cytochrome c oxidase subunit 3